MTMINQEILMANAGVLYEQDWLVITCDKVQCWTRSLCETTPGIWTHAPATPAGAACSS